MAAAGGEAPADLGFRAELFTRGLLIESGVPGVYGHGPAFEDVRTGLEMLLSREAAAGGAERLRFPPLLPRHQLESSGFLDSFPQLAGTVYAFHGDEAAAAVQSARAAAHEPWGEFQRMTDVALMPAACYPVYPAIAARGPLPEAGVFVEAGASWVFRHEPSEDPMRRQAFRQHELVRIGASDDVMAWREEWAQRGLRILGGLGLDVELETASDPFFGRRGRLLARSQREHALKYEISLRSADGEPTALASFNYHLEHFTGTYAIKLRDGRAAHSACLGFGHERIVLALLRAHGLEPARWPQPVRETLGLR